MRRSKVRAAAAKVRRPKSAKLKRHGAPNEPTGASSPAVSEDEFARLTGELNEERRQRTATSEVLHLLSGSHGDLSRLFDTILTNATNLCQANFGTLHLYEGDAFRIVAQHNAPPAYAELRQREPLVRARPMLRMAETKQLFQIADVRAYAASNPADKDVAAFAKLSGARTVISVPMLKNGEMVGAIATYRQEVRTFSDREIELIKDFAAQAVIAIENARLLNELRQSLEQQTATSDVLQVISSSPGELEPVFTTMLEKAVRICDAKYGTLYLCENTRLRLVAAHDVPEFFAARRGAAFDPAPGGGLDGVMSTKRPVQIPDLAATRSYAERHPSMVEAVELAGIRTGLAVPMLKDDELIGIVGIHRREVLRFTDKQIDLVKNFAAQAVIAIENARLLNELRQRTADLTERTADLTEALEQQTATSDVLQVISSSPGQLEPVFATMLEKAVRICDANFGTINRWDGEALHLVASHDMPPAFVEYRKSTALRPGPESPVSRILVTKSLFHIDDLTTTQEYLHREPSAVAAAELGGIRAVLGVPLLRESEFIGVLFLSRREPRAFTDKQIELSQSFAAQAVIAIENARLVRELRESLEQQTAISEILQLINSSPGASIGRHLGPVFNAMIEKAMRLCEATFGSLNSYDGQRFHTLALCGLAPEAAQVFREPWVAGSGTHHEKLTRGESPVHTDCDASVAHSQSRAVIDDGARTTLLIAIRKDDKLLGSLWFCRREVRPFSDKQIALLRNFADQAVIAIENSRLLSELRDLNRQLEQRVKDQVGEIERIGRLRRFLPPQVADLIVASGSEKQLESHRSEITALFCDLRGFTGFSEASDPEDVMALLSDYHAAIGEIINKYSGTLERFAGDGVMVIFNDPVPVENPALQAVLMALEMREAIGALTETWRRLGHEIGFGIGIAHGFATLGTIGFEGRFDYAAIGTVSNVASRLCDEAKPGQILISPRVLTKVENAVKVEAVGEFELKGIRRPLAAYNVLAANPTN